MLLLPLPVVLSGEKNGIGRADKTPSTGTCVPRPSLPLLYDRGSPGNSHCLADGRKVSNETFRCSQISNTMFVLSEWGMEPGSQSVLPTCDSRTGARKCEAHSWFRAEARSFLPPSL